MARYKILGKKKTNNRFILFHNQNGYPYYVVDQCSKCNKIRIELCADYDYDRWSNMPTWCEKIEKRLDLKKVNK